MCLASSITTNTTQGGSTKMGPNQKYAKISILTANAAMRYSCNQGAHVRKIQTKNGAVELLLTPQYGNSAVITQDEISYFS